MTNKCEHYQPVDDGSECCQDYVRGDCVNGKVTHELCLWHGKGNKEVLTSMSCSSCEHWMPIKEHCGQQITASRYSGRTYCRHWEEHPKHTIMRKKMDVQVNVSQWNTKEHRRLELS